VFEQAQLARHAEANFIFEAARSLTAMVGGKARDTVGLAFIPDKITLQGRQLFAVNNTLLYVTWPVIDDRDPDGLPENATLVPLAEESRKVRYRTPQVGQWHVDTGPHDWVSIERLRTVGVESVEPSPRRVFSSSDQMHASNVTAVIGTYNRAHFLGEALGSVLGQTVQPAQVIVLTTEPRKDSRCVSGTRAMAQPFFLDRCDNLTILEQNCSRVVPPTGIERDRILG
jgi:hypothetical protein